jgi:hypothetical protein
MLMASAPAPLHRSTSVIDLTALDPHTPRPPMPDPTGPGFIYGVRNLDNPEGVLTIGRTYNMWASAERSRTGRACGRIDGYPANSRWLFALRVKNQQAAENAVKKQLAGVFRSHNGSPEMFYCEPGALLDAVRGILRAQEQLAPDVRNFPSDLAMLKTLNKDQVKRIFEGKDSADYAVDRLVKRDAWRCFHNFVRGPHEELDRVFKWSRGNVFGFPPVKGATEPTLRKMCCLWYKSKFGDDITLSTLQCAERFVEAFNQQKLYPDGKKAFIPILDGMDVDL